MSHIAQVSGANNDDENVAKVPFFNYPAMYTHDREKYLAIIDDVLSRGAYICQKDLSDFEANLASYMKIGYALGAADCTNGMVMALRAAGIGPGDEVIFPSHTFVASPGSIKQVGAVPVPCDIDDDNMMCAESAESMITEKTKAIMPVQLNGRVCNMDAIEAVAKRHNLMIVEDSAQALGATYKGRYAGSFGVFGAFSFYPAKTLGCFGDGGAVVTDSEELYNNMLLQRDHGRHGSPDVQMWGMNCRLDNVQAAILDHKLSHYQEDVERRRDIARRYQDAFEEIDDLILPKGPDHDADHFDIFQNYELQAGKRDDLREFLGARNVGTIIQWGGKAIHQFEALGYNVSLPRTEAFFRKCFMLPMNTLLSDAEVEKVCNDVREFYGLNPKG